MAEKEISIRDSGYAGVLKHILSDFLKERTQLPVFIEPQPITVFEPHIRVMFAGFDFEGVGDLTGYDIERLCTLKMDCLLTLTAMGDGPDVFLDKVVDASFRLNRLFERPFSIQTVDGYGITVQGKSRGQRQFFKNEEEGKKPYIYEENFDVSIFLPYAEVLNG
ncbi:MAG TPA: hypothetical protein PKU94_07655 [Candidatus Hydrothermia bacterium]|mgnify:CR=1 FL=1|nr:hypothetical protein [Candidatus Hydrothermia bacterium]